MRKRTQKTRCEKRQLRKSEEICRTYDKVQSACADYLDQREDVVRIRCNVELDGLKDGDYTTDFVCEKENGELMVRECVYRQYLTKPMTARLLESSRNYWLSRGVLDWGIVLDAVNEEQEKGDESNE